MNLDFSIGENPVLDCNCSGWPEASREQFQQDAQAMDGVEKTNGAGISTVRVYYTPDVDVDALRKALTELANTTLPDHDFTC